MVSELVSSRGLIWRLVMRDLQSRYGRSMLSYVWLLLLPAAAVAVPMFLVSRRIVPMGQTDLPYPGFVLINIVVWQLFAGCIQSCASSLSRAGTLVTRINFPKIGLVVASAGQPLMEFLVKLPLVVAVLVFLHVHLGTGAVGALLLTIPVLLLAVGLGFALSLLSLVVRDVLEVLPTVLLVGMFLSPVLYPAPVRSPFYVLNVINPLSPILGAQQHLIAYGSVGDSGLLCMSILLSVLVFASGWRIFHASMPRIAERA